MARVTLHKTAWSSFHCKHWAPHNGKLIKACQKTRNHSGASVQQNFMIDCLPFTFLILPLKSHIQLSAESLNAASLEFLAMSRWKQGISRTQRCLAVTMKRERERQLPIQPEIDRLIYFIWEEAAEQWVTWVRTELLWGKEKYHLKEQLWCAHRRAGTEVRWRGSQ